MTEKLWWHIIGLTRKLWVRAALFSLLGIATALASVVLDPYIPDNLSANVGAQAVDDVLTIIASSMLAVTTFTLSIMVQAYSAAANQATPRATTLLIEDPTAQNVLATFLGAFLFALVGIVALNAGVYGENGRVILFGVTLFVILAITISLIQWFHELTTFGRLTSTAARVESAAERCLKRYAQEPLLGCRDQDQQNRSPELSRHIVCADRVGYVQHVDLGALQSCAEQIDGQLDVLAQPGAFVDPSVALVAQFRHPDAEPESEPETEAERADSGPEANGTAEDVETRLRRAFTIGDTRTFDQDPRYGVMVLAEIAQRALSPAVNDPGTAIDIIGRQQRLLTMWADELVDITDRDAASCTYDRLWTRRVATADLFDDAFRAIGRDGAGMVEVVTRLLASLAALEATGNRALAIEARRHATMAQERARAALSHPDDLARVDAMAPVSSP